jgi:hypothetical protein
MREGQAEGSSDLRKSLMQSLRSELQHQEHQAYIAKRYLKKSLDSQREPGNLKHSLKNSQISNYGHSAGPED